LVGAGGHARACIDVIELEGRMTIGGLVGIHSEVNSEVLGYKVLGEDNDLERLAGEFGIGIVTVGQIKSPEIRMRLFARLQQLGVKLPAIVSPLGYVSKHASVGEGSIVLHGAIVNAGASVGRNCIVNSQALVEHDAVIGDHCHVATNAAINSGVRVGEGTFIGSGATIRQGVRIGRRCVIGMGQRVLADCADGTQIPPAKKS
jgi:sugar O-acyltransferase (sialic acid O-acetyltransferase NeuD family)